MTDQMRSLHADLDYVKTLAREGRHAPLVGGPILLLAGLDWGTAALLMYGYMKGLIPATQAVANWTWIVATVIFVAGLFSLKRAIRNTPGAGSLNNRANSAGWTGAGWGIGAICAAIGLAAWRLNDINLVWLLAPAVLALYGTCWTVAAAMTERKWLSWLAIGSYAGAILLGLMAGEAEMFLAYAGALYLLAALPGYLLMREQAAPVA